MLKIISRKKEVFHSNKNTGLGAFRLASFDTFNKCLVVCPSVCPADNFQGNANLEINFKFFKAQTTIFLINFGK